MLKRRRGSGAGQKDENEQLLSVHMSGKKNQKNSNEDHRSETLFSFNNYNILYRNFQINLCSAFISLLVKKHSLALINCCQIFFLFSSKNNKNINNKHKIHQQFFGFYSIYIVLLDRSFHFLFENHKEVKTSFFKRLNLDRKIWESLVIDWTFRLA